jgi:hypothetical protein
MSDQKMTILDRQLQEIAMSNWAQFVAIIGPDAVKSAKVCLLRQKQASYAQISIKLGVTENQARYACQKCEEKGV